MTATSDQREQAGREWLQWVAAQVQQAANLEQQGQYDEAQRAIQACVDRAISERKPLFIDHYTDMLMVKAFCHASQQQWAEAMPIYQQVERVLQRAEGWHGTLPDGLFIAVTQSHDPTPRLAAVYDSMALAHDRQGQTAQAQDLYQTAIALFKQADLAPGALQVYRHLLMGQQQRQEWQALQTTSQEMLTLANELDDLLGRIAAWQFLAQANVNLNRLPDAKTLLEKVVSAERRIGHPDLPRDEMLLQQLSALLQQQGSGAQHANASPPAVPVLLTDAVRVLSEFAAAHAGPSSEVVGEREEKRLFGLLGSKRVPVETIHWQVEIEEMYTFRPGGQAGNIPGAVLDLQQEPPTIIRVTVEDSAYQVIIMVERQVPGVSQPVMAAAVDERVTVEPGRLRAFLEGLLEQGVLVKAGHQLRYVSKES
jgi:tetratricopeptide (TPR) repeat protein